MLQSHLCKIQIITVHLLFSLVFPTRKSHLPLLIMKPYGLVLRVPLSSLRVLNKLHMPLISFDFVGYVWLIIQNISRDLHTAAPSAAVRAMHRAWVANAKSPGKGTSIVGLQVSSQFRHAVSAFPAFPARVCAKCMPVQCVYRLIQRPYLEPRSDRILLSQNISKYNIIGWISCMKIYTFPLDKENQQQFLCVGQ